MYTEPQPPPVNNHQQLATTVFLFIDALPHLQAWGHWICTIKKTVEATEDIVCVLRPFISSLEGTKDSKEKRRDTYRKYCSKLKLHFTKQSNNYHLQMTTDPNSQGVVSELSAI